MELNRKAKGDLAELKVATDLLGRGYKIAFPYGEDWDYDLILCRSEELERVQVKYGRSTADILEVKCRSHSLTNGKVTATKLYTAEMIDWLAVWDATSECCFYIPAEALGAGMSTFSLRFSATRNGQVRGIHPASNFRAI